MAKRMENRSRPVQDLPAPRRDGRFFLDAVAQGILSCAILIFRLAWWCIRWGLATVVMLTVMAAAGYYVFTQAVAGDTYVSVPVVAGLPLGEAANVLAERGLELGKHSELVSDQVPKYYVIAQRPEAGRVIRRGRKVHLTVSKGPEYLRPPDLRGKILEEAQAHIEGAHFQVGTVAHIPHSARRDTILAQDPPLDKGLLRGGEIHLLVSDGPVFRMPDLVGGPLHEVVNALGQLPVTAVPVRVDASQAPVEVVLAQQPPPGATIHEGQIVYYDVRATETRVPPHALRKVEVAYTLPPSPLKRAVRVDVIDEDGVRQTIFPRERDLVDGLAPKYSEDTTLFITRRFRNELTVEFYLDGHLARRYYYRDSADPIITDYGESAGGQDSA